MKMHTLINIDQWNNRLPLQGNLVLVRQFNANDLSPNYISWINDPEIMRYSNQRFIKHDINSAQHYWNSFKDTPNFFLAIESKNTAQHIGTITVYIQQQHGTADVGILIGDKNFSGRGYGKEAWNLVIDWLLNTLGIRKVTAGTLRCNHSMIRLIEASGMRLEGVRKAQELVDGKLQDVLYFAKFT